MSFYIKGLDLPKHSGKNSLPELYSIRIKVYNDGRVEAFKIGSYEKHEVVTISTPHGDLIDKEPIKKFITEGINKPAPDSYGYDGIEILTELEFAPAIIEEEK